MEFRRFKDKYVVRLNKGEEVIASLTKLCDEENIRLGSISGIGASNKVKMGLFDIVEKKYYSDTIEKDLEITSLMGNITRKDEEVYLHLHINVANREQIVYGGHLNEAYISATCEIIIDVIDGEVDREFSEEIGLNLFKF